MPGSLQKTGPPDMIANSGDGPMRVAVVGAPTYFARRCPPRVPDDLARHGCVQYRRAPGTVYEWPFERDGKSRQVSLDGRVMVNDMDLAVRADVDGLGIAYTIHALANPFLRSGQLVRVLQDWSPLSDGLFHYYPGHRQVPVALGALIDMLHAARSAAPTRGLLEIPLGGRLNMPRGRRRAPVIQRLSPRRRELPLRSASFSLIEQVRSVGGPTPGDPLHGRSVTRS
jgi:LysR substrate binding domain